MADRGKWRLPAENLALRHAGWGLLRKWRVASALSPWGGQVPSQLLVSIMNSPRSRVWCQPLSSCHCAWDLFLHPEAGVHPRISQAAALSF